MDKKEIKPIAVELKKGRLYTWCKCGDSDNQPFCDGSHAGTNCEPVLFTVEEDKTKKLCVCKKSSNQPYCDGTHRNL